jgi:uncharacterized membrane protein (DUF4010 family)
VALAFSRRSKEEPALSRSFAGAIVLASTIMFPRVLVVVAAACPPLFLRIWKPVAIVMAVGVVASLLLQFRGGKDERAGEAVAMKNPFELGSAVKFGILLAIISFVSRAAKAEFGDGALYLVSLVVGLGDADGFASQAAELARGEVAAKGLADAGPLLSTAATACILAMLANTLVKGGMTVFLGAREMRRYTIPAFGAMAVVGVAVAFLMA